MLGYVYVKFKRTNQRCSSSKISQSMLNGALVIEMVNNSFNKVRNVLTEKIRDMGSEGYISTRFCQISK